jgi:ABC-2 type transport system permease protein
MRKDIAGMNRLHTFDGALRYEFHMQIHRLAVWATFLGFAALVFAVAGQGNWTHWSGEKNAFDSFANWTVVVNLFIPPALGILLADRLCRDRRLHIDELLNTTLGSIGARLLGKYLGSLLATLVPMLLIYSIGIGYISYHWQAIQGWWAVLRTLPDALALFLAVIVPGVLFIAAFSLAVPVLLWLPLYQFLFVCYWFWGNAFDPGKGLPTLSNTILTPLGGYMLAGFFGQDSGLIVHHATVVQGVESLLLLLAIAACVLIALWRYLLWRQA